MANRLVPADTETGKLPDVVLDDLSSRYAPIGGSAVARQRYDAAGEALAAKLELGGGGDVVLAVIGDSTGDENTEWVRLWANHIAATHPKLFVEYIAWNYTPSAYGTPVTIQAGEGYVPGGDRTTVSDTFDRTAAALVGSTPQAGAAWTGVTGAFNLNGASAVSLGPATGGYAVSDGGATGDGTVTATGVQLDTTPGTTVRQLQIYNKFLSTANQLYTYINVGTNGFVSWGISKRVAGTLTTLVVGGALGLAANAVNTFNVAMTVTGTAVSATVNGVTATASITSADVTTFASSTAAGFGMYGGASDAGTAIGSFMYRITANAASSGQKLTIYNGSVPGAQLGVQRARLPEFIPVRPDVLFISSSHNYGSMVATSYMSVITEFIGGIRALYANLPIVLSSQNPQFAGAAAYPSAHLARMLALRVYALTNDFGYLPVIEAFLAQADGGRSRVVADGIHPNQDGSTLWYTVAADYLDSKYLATKVTS